jgi:tight adherence protein B
LSNPIIIAGSVATGLGALALFFLGRETRADKRRAAIGATTSRALGDISQAADKAARKKKIADGVRGLEKKTRRRVSLEARIEQAGLSISRRQYILVSAAIGLGFVLAIAIQLHSLGLALLLGVMGGVGLPHFFLSRLRKRRMAKFIADFPNAIDVIVRGVKAGLPLGDTIRIVAVESHDPVRSEFRRIVESMSIGMTLPEAVEKMAQRVPITETNFFSIVITIQGKAGGNLAEAIGNLSRVLRERKKMKGKIGAMAMEAKASAAIIGAVPLFVVGALYVSSPAYVSLLWTTTHGRLISAAALGWMAAGATIMKRMITFKF